jgi:hypothetical protein
MDPFDLTPRLKNAPLEPLVDLLRQIHQRQQDAPADPQREPVPLQPESRSATSLAVEALRAIHDRQTDGDVGPPAARPTPTRKTPALGPPLPGTSYDRVRKHFHRHEAGLRRQAWLTDQILDQLQANGAASPVQGPALQQELRLRCPRGGATGGGFVLANEFDRYLRISFSRSALRGAPAGFEQAGLLRFEPAEPVLAAGVEETVRLSIDLAGCPFEPGDETGLIIDVLGDGRLLHKLWVSITIDEAIHAIEER